MFSVGKFLYELKVNAYAITHTVNVDFTDIADLPVGKWLNLKTSWLEGRKKKTTYEEVVFSFDTITEAEVRGSSNVVGYPIEKGYSVTDYKYQNPTNIHIIGLLERSSMLGNLARGALNMLSNKLGFGEFADPITKMRTDLEYYKSGLYPLNIQTKSGLYENYTLVDFNLPENFDNYGLMEVEMAFQQIMTTGEGKKNASNQDTVEGGLAKVTRKLTGGLIGG